MASIYLGKMCIHFFSEMLHLKCNEHAVFFLEVTRNEVNGSFFLEKGPFCDVMFGGCPYFINKTLDKV